MNYRTLLAATGLFLVMVATACQPAAALQEAVAAPKTAGALLTQAITKSQEVKSYHFTMNLTMSMDMGGTSMSIPLEGEGDFVSPDKMRVAMEMKSPMQMKIEMINIGASAYVKNPGADDWEEVSAAQQSPLPISPSDTLQFFNSKPDRVEDLGSDIMNSFPVRHIGYTLDEAGLKALNAHFAQSSGMELSQARVEVWVGETDKQMHRFLLDGAMEMSMPGTGTADAMKATVTLDMGMSDFDKPIQIQAPAGAKPASSALTRPAFR